MILLNDREEAAYFYDDLNNLGFSDRTLFFPSSYKRSVQYGEPEQENIVQRTEVLNQLSLKEKPVIVVSYPELKLGTIFQLNLSTSFYTNTVLNVLILFMNPASFQFGEVLLMFFHFQMKILFVLTFLEMK